MKNTVGISYCLMVAMVLFSVGTRKVLGDEACPEKQENRLFDQAFGMALTPADFLTSIMPPWGFHDYFRPWRHLASLSSDLGSTIKLGKDKFQVNLDVQHFAPNEISVKTADGYVVIEAKHEEKKDEHGFVSRQFIRRYSLPDGVKSEDVVSQLSSDGVLTVTAPRKVVEGTGEREVPITQTGPVRKETKKEEDQGTCSNEKSCDKV